MVKVISILLLFASVALGQELFPGLGPIMEASNPQASAPASDIPGIFVDSIAGSDSNAGTSNAPFASLAKVTSTLGATSTVTTNIYLKRGSVFREDFNVPTNAVVNAYGSNNLAPFGVAGGVTNSKPIVSGAVYLTNSMLTLFAGKTNTYTITLADWIATNSYAGLRTSNVLMVWDNNARMAGWTVSSSTYAYTADTVDAGSNRFFYNPSTHVLYISPSDGTDPATNGRVYEASIRTLAMHNGGGSTAVTNVIAEKSYAYSKTGQQGYAILNNGGGTYSRCVGRYSWNHAIGCATDYSADPLIFDRCYAADCENPIADPGPATLFVGYRNAWNNITGSVSTVTYAGCLAKQPSIDPTKNTSPYQTVGFYSHDGLAYDNTNRVTCIVTNCVAQFCYSGYTDLRNTLLNSNNTAVSCFQGVWGQSLTNWVWNFRAYNCYYGVIAASGYPWTIHVANGQFWLNTNSCIRAGSGTTNVFATNNIFAYTNGAVASVKGYGLAAANTTPVYHSWSNSFCGIQTAYEAGQMGSGDYNNYYRKIWYDYPSPYANQGADMLTRNTRTQWRELDATWKSDWGTDANSTAADPAYSDASFTYTVTDPTGGDAN